MSDELTPITRKETFLAKAGGQNVVTPTPITREETFLQAIIDNGSGGGGGGGALLKVGITYSESTATLDKTWKEINDATFAVLVQEFEEGGIVNAERGPIFATDIASGEYSVYVGIPNMIDDAFVFTCFILRTDNENGYPSVTMGE